MPESLIISDLHLSRERPDVVRLFLRFLQQRVGDGAQLYILGDLFDAWIGDDDSTSPVPEIIAGLRAASDRGCRIQLMHGNRDFLIGDRFCLLSGCRLLQDPAVVDLDGRPTLLMHGDLLCSDDIEYQQARKLLRSPAFIADFLSRSIPERVALAAEYRRKSGEVVSLKSSDIMDVNQQTVIDYMTRFDVTLLIHGHTHRPGEQRIQLGDRTLERMVLGEWHDDCGSYLSLSDRNIHRYSFSADSGDSTPA